MRGAELPGSLNTFRVKPSDPTKRSIKAETTIGTRLRIRLLRFERCLTNMGRAHSPLRSCDENLIAASVAAKILRRAVAHGLTLTLKQKIDAAHGLIEWSQRGRVGIQSRHHPTARTDAGLARVLPAVDA